MHKKLKSNYCDKMTIDINKQYNSSIKNKKQCVASTYFESKTKIKTLKN